MIHLKIFWGSEEKLAQLTEIVSTLEQPISDIALFPYKHPPVGTANIQFGLIKTVKEVADTKDKSGNTYTRSCTGGTSVAEGRKV